jgi:hypothetical protein
MLDRYWDSFVSILMGIFIPVISLYHTICENPFLNIAIKESSGFEQVGDILLTPFQYLFGGKEAILQDDGSWKIIQKFEYQTALLPKSIVSIATLPASFVIGSAVKGLGFLSKETQKRHISLLNHLQDTNPKSNNNLYEQLGLPIGSREEALFVPSQGYQRRPGDEQHLAKAKEALKDIGKLLTQANIPWWIDCGTLLGAYRYGGVIPWDNDIDVALLLPDFENARKVFNQLDSNKYQVQDWSGRDFPQTFLKIYVKETQDMIDIYFYDIDPIQKQCTYIFSLDQSIFFFNWWKEGERRFTKPISFNQLFPLKRTLFDGIEVFIPNETVSFLQRYYGENLAPVRIYDTITNRFEKDLSHPYWLNPNVH